MMNSVMMLTELMVLAKIQKIRIEGNSRGSKFGCTVDYSPTQYGSTIEQACSKAVAALEKKWSLKKSKSDAYADQLIQETGTEGLF